MTLFRQPRIPHRTVPAPVPAAGPDAVRSELARLLASSIFTGSERHRRFLQFIVEEAIEGRADSIKESTVAVAVFDRATSFDPRADSVVRVEARNLRARLNEYYLGEGRADPVLIHLPKGSYVPTFRLLSAAPPIRIPFLPTGFRPLAALLLAAFCGFAWWAVSRWGLPGSAGPRTIAVLPFLDLAGTPGDEYLADGLVEDLTTELALLPGARVSARTSAFQFRGTNEDVRAIGRKLDVSKVLEGSVRREGTKVRVTAQLIDAQSGYHMWSNTYDTTTADLQSVVDAIERAVAREMGLRASPADVRSHVAPVDAREAYWRGLYIRGDWQRRPDSVPYFDRAVAVDPQFAEAWGALAATHAGMAYYWEGPMEPEVAKAKEAARLALALDESTAEAHLALAILAYSHDRNWTLAEREYRRALALNPSSSLARLSFASALTTRDRVDEALEQVELARQVDPVSFLSANTESSVLFFARRYKQALHAARLHLDMDPKFMPARLMSGMCLTALGQPNEALSELQRVAREGVRSFPVLGRLGSALIRTGRQPEALAIVAEIQSMQKSEPKGASGVALAQIYAAMGDHQQAIANLGLAADAFVPDANLMGVDPAFDPLHTEPAFRALCARLGLPVR